MRANARNPRTGRPSGGYQPSRNAASAVSAARIESRKTWLCGAVLDDPQNGSRRRTISGWLTAHWYFWPAPIDHPSTSANFSIPNTSVTEQYWDSTLSPTSILRKRARSPGGGVLDGERDRPLGTMTIQRAGSRAIPGPISHSLSQCRPEYQVG